MANTLMFEVGVQMAKEQFEAIKSQIEKYNKEWQKDLQIKVEIENLESLTKALSQIGDTSSLRNLRAEIAALNKEFLQLSKGAGGTGSIADRGLAQDIERQSQNIERYTSKIKELTEERSKLVGGVRNVNYESINSEIEKYILMLEGAKKKLQELQEQGNKPIVSANSNAANAFNLEGTAAQEAVEKLNKLVTEKQQVVDAERKLAESSKTGGQTLKEEADNADKTAQSIKGVGKAQKDAADASKKAEKEQAGTVDNLAIKYQTLIARIENWQSSLSKLLAGGDSKYFGAQLNEAIEAYQKLKEAALSSGGSKEELDQLRSAMTFLGQSYANVNKEAKEFNKTSEQAEKAQQRAAEKAAAIQQKFEAELQKRYSGLGIRQNDPGLKNIQTAMDGLIQKLQKVREDIDLYKHAIGSGNKESIDFGQKGLKEAETAAESLMRQYIALANTMDKLSAGGKERSLLSTEQSNKELQMLNEAFRTGSSEMQKQSKAEAQALKEQAQAKKDAEKAAKEQAKADKANADSMADAGKKASNLNKELEKLKITGLRERAEKADVDTSAFDAAVAAVNRYKMALESIHNNGGVWTKNDEAGLAAARNELAIQEALLKKSTLEKEAAAKATSQLTLEEQKFAQSISHSTGEMGKQSQVLSDLKTMAMQYLSVWGAQSFVNSIIETGGQLEQQRLSLSAILGDMEKAGTLFGQIKTLALKSPFGVVELDKMSKQLAAYSFEYDELFDWTKRLADISAATGTSVDRLALALGHVRSEGALSGYTLRQFAMANVPVLRMLSENLGISSKEVRERVKKKDISAEDVQDILRQLTDDGGMFANAQETMSEALNAKFKNLRDAFDIMYGEIAEGGVGDSLKELAVILTQGAKHWERLGKDILMVATALGVGKAAMLLYNSAIGSNTAATLRSAFVAKEKMVANLKLAKSYRQLTIEEQDELNMQRKWWSFGSKLNSRNIMVLLSTKKLTVAELERAVAMGKVSKADAVAAMNLLKLNTAQMQSVRVLGFWGRIGATIANGFRMAGLALKSFLASAAPLLALTAIFEVWNRRSEQKDNAKSLASSMAGNARGKEAFELKGSLADSSKLSEEALKSNTEEMKNALVAAGAYTDELKKQVDAIDDSAKKYDFLKDKIGEVADKYEELKASQEKMLEDAWDAGGSFLSDNMAKDAEQYDEAFSQYEKTLTVGSKQIKDAIQNWMQANGLYKEEFDKMTGKQLFEQLSKENQNAFLLYGWDAKGVDDQTKEAIRNISRAYNTVGDKLKELEGPQGEEFARIMKAMYEEAFGVDLDKATQEQVNAFDKWLRETIGRAEKLSKDAKEALRGIVIDFTVTLKPNYVVEQPQTAQDVIDSQIGDNKWLSGFFGRQNTSTQVWTADTAQKEVKKYKKLFGDISLSNLDTAPKKINSLLDGLEETKKNLKNTLSSGLLSKEEKDEINKSLKETTDSIDLGYKALKDVGGKRQRKGSKSGGSKEDKDAKVLRERVRILKEAADSYQYWREKVGDTGAEAHMQEEFGQLLTEQNLQLKNADELKAKLKSLRDEYSNKPQTKAMVEAIKEIDKELAQLNRKDFEKTTEEFASKVQIELDSLTRAWEIFNNVREATGNVELAVQISGADYAGGKTRNIADALREKIQKDFAAAGGGIAFDMNLSDKDIEESIKMSMPAASQDQIKGLVDEYKKWRDLQRDVLKNDIDVFAKLVGGSKDYESQVQKINDGLEKQVAALNEVAKNNPEKKKDVDKAIGAATAQAEYDKWKLSTQYINLMNNSLSLTRKEVDEGINVAMQRLNDLMQHNSISAQEYADEMAKIQNIQSEFTKNSFFGTNTAWGAGIMGGLSGLRNFYQSQLNSSTIIKSDLENKWKQRGLDRKEWEQYEKASNTITSSNSKLEDLNRLESLTSSFDALAKAIDPVINLFNKLGMTEIGSILGAGQNALQSASSMGIGAAVLTGSATAGMWGAGIGAGLSIAGSIADSLFGGLDDALQKEIEASKQRQKEMEYMSKNLETALDRALGGVYNVGNTEQGQKAMADFNKNIDRYRQEIKAREEYETKKAQAEKDLESAKKSGNMLDIIKANDKLASVENDEKMRNWTGAIRYLQETTVDAIKKADETGKYYDMQRASMMVQRDELQHQIDAEEDKKDSDNGAISDMQQQIKEIEDQWENFARDMMQALYDIDVKDWASQFGDTLYEAWKKGEDGAEAFKKKASEIIGNITKNILVKRVIETALKPVEDAIIKMMDDTSGELSEKDFTEQIGGLLEDSIGKIVPTVNAALDAVDAGLQKEGLPSLKENADSSLSGNIKGITENTADLLASYLNAIRADVSVNRMELLNIRDNYLKDIKTQITSASSSLHNIENHTAAIMRSNDVIAEKITNLDNNITGLKNRVWQVPVA